ncbi:MAG: TadE/TadG family type IV pilus assembly protein [Phototrophicaceae bacterium]|jgi:hypothetical protein
MIRKLLDTIVRVLDGTSAEYAPPNRGQSVVELAFMIPIFLLLLVGLVEVGWFTNNYLILLEVTRVGARYGTTREGDSTVVNWETIPAARIGALPPPFYTVGSTEREISFDYRDCSNEDTIDSFYGGIICFMEQSMDPLQIEDGISDTELLNGNTPLVNDDIVISVFTSNLIPAAPATGTDPVAYYSISRPFEDNEAMDGLAPFAVDDDGQTLNTRNPLAAQVKITGRYPSNANECSSFSERDPFDINGNGIVRNVVSGFDREGFEYDEIRRDIIDGYNAAVSGTANSNTANGRRLLADTALETRRGFAYTGNWEIETLPGCYGSNWSLTRMEEMVNFVQSGFNEVQIAQLPPSQAFVLVEIYWRHTLLLNLPGYSPLYDLLGGEDGSYINVWAAFPVPSAEFNLDLTLP